MAASVTIRMQVTKVELMRSTLAFEPRTHVTRSPELVLVI